MPVPASGFQPDIPAGITAAPEALSWTTGPEDSRASMHGDDMALEANREAVPTFAPIYAEHERMSEVV